MRLSVVAKEPLEQGKTIIFLDEIQEFKDIVTRIKFLVEDGTFRYIMSGSLPVSYTHLVHNFGFVFQSFLAGFA